MAHPTGKPPRNYFKDFQYNAGVDPPSEVRNVLLVVATLIAAVTFQAGVSPPGGVWQDGERAGKAIYADQAIPFVVFLVFNTYALASSALVIISLTMTFPFRFEILLATVSMVVTYGSSVFAVTSGIPQTFRYVLATVVVPFVARFLIQMFRKLRTA